MTLTTDVPARSAPATRLPIIVLAVAIVIGATVILVVLRPAIGAPVRTITLQTQNDSGVAGTVSFTDLGARTRVDVTVDPAGNPDMPAHVHPGTCDDMTPQPKFPLENVRAGNSSTVVPASIDELFDGSLAINIHKSNDDLRAYMACVNIR